MVSARITKATFTVIALVLLASAGRAQDTEGQTKTFKVPGDDTIYRLPTGNWTLLRPVEAAATAAAVKPKLPEKISYVHLEFVLKQLDNGKVSSSRTYTMDANTDSNYRGQLRTSGDVYTKTDDGKTDHNQIRIDLDCAQLKLIDTDVFSLTVSSNISGPDGPRVQSQQDLSAYLGQFEPVIRVGKPTVVFSAAGPTPEYATQLEVTVTPIRLPSEGKP